LPSMTQTDARRQPAVMSKVLVLLSPRPMVVVIEKRGRQFGRAER
jgi:hypothetical protein